MLKCFFNCAMNTNEWTKYLERIILLFLSWASSKTFQWFDDRNENQKIRNSCNFSFSFAYAKKNWYTKTIDCHLISIQLEWKGDKRSVYKLQKWFEFINENAIYMHSDRLFRVFFKLVSFHSHNSKSNSKTEEIDAVTENIAFNATALLIKMRMTMWYRVLLD